MPSAELITIGTEILLGEIQETNSYFLARQLRDFGIDLFRMTSIGDNVSRIASTINESLSRADIVITTGGLGPTVDDPTRDAVALAFNTKSEFHPELWKIIEQRFISRGIAPSANNQRQAFLPFGAKVISNPVGTAPAFYYEQNNKLVVCLPGVPKEMEFLTTESVIPLITQIFHLKSVIKVRVIHLSGIGESSVDERIAEFEKMSNPTVGLLAHPGQVDIRITAKADNLDAASEMIANVETQICELFPTEIYGCDEQSLTDALIQLLNEKCIDVFLHCFGLEKFWPVELINSRIKIEHTALMIRFSEIEETRNNSKTNKKFDLFCNYFTNGNECQIDFLLFFNGHLKSDSLIYNGPIAQGPSWAINRLLDIVRRYIINNK